MSLYEELEFETPSELNEWEFTGEMESGELYGESMEVEQLEMELAHELLEITTEAELEEFLGKLVRSVGRGVSSFARSSVGKTLGGVLKTVAKKALPVVGGALGNLVAPGVGGMVGSRLGSLAGSLLEAEEAELLGEAEAELEAARRYVRWARATTRNSMRAPRNLPPRAVVRAAAISSARRHAPALLRPYPSGVGFRHRRARRILGYPVYTPYMAAPVAWDPGDSYAGAGYDPGAAQGFQDDDSYTDDGQGDEIAGPSGASAQGRWVRRGPNIVVYGV
ncbi:MAG: hypothetical protein AB7W59_18615 [Acidimicrobiia bacterium]